jgi:hypothetical protein
MKKWSLTLKVFLIVLAIGVLYVLIASIVRISTGEIEIGMAVGRFFIGSIIAAAVAGIAAAITSLVVSIKQKRKLNLPLLVFLIALAIGVLYVLIASIVRLSIGQISKYMFMPRFIFGSIFSVLGAGVIAGITALVVAIKKLGE